MKCFLVLVQVDVDCRNEGRIYRSERRTNDFDKRAIIEAKEKQSALHDFLKKLKVYAPGIAN